MITIYKVEKNKSICIIHFLKRVYQYIQTHDICIKLVRYSIVHCLLNFFVHTAHSFLIYTCIYVLFIYL